MIVTPDAPVNAVKNEQVIKATSATPPGSHPKSARAKSTSRCGVFDSAMIVPAKVNSGIAMNRGDCEILSKRSSKRRPATPTVSPSLPWAVMMPKPLVPWFS